MQQQQQLKATESNALADICSVEIYLSHVAKGKSLRSLARQTGMHPSTILRRVRKMENRRDDPLFDQAMERLADSQLPPTPLPNSEDTCMQPANTSPNLECNALLKPHIAMRFLKRLSEKKTFLALASDMENGAIMRTSEEGAPVRLAVVGRADAQALALKDWIRQTHKGRVNRYEITASGEAALRRLMAEELSTGQPDQTDFDMFGDQIRNWGENDDLSEMSPHAGQRRVNLAESPLSLLSRRKDRDGRPFLSDDLVAAGERLREDFELARMGPQITQNWERFLTGKLSLLPSTKDTGGVGEAAKRFRAAMDALGPGLSDAALRCCCFLEGMETTEKKMGWSARSGKIVLRIALQRLKLHYSREFGSYGPLIG